MIVAVSLISSWWLKIILIVRSPENCFGVPKFSLSVVVMSLTDPFLDVVAGMSVFFSSKLFLKKRCWLRLTRDLFRVCFLGGSLQHGDVKSAAFKSRSELVVELPSLESIDNLKLQSEYFLFVVLTIVGRLAVPSKLSY